MRFAVIDTCVLKSLINELYDDRNLNVICQWSRDGEITFLFSNIQKQEWDKHKTEKLATIKERERENRKKRLRNEDHNIADVEMELTPAEKRVHRQVSLIDALISATPLIEKYDRVLRLIDDLKEAEEPPFFHKRTKNNEKDAKIIFSSLEFVKLARENELVLISDNTAEFESKDVPGKIHLCIQNNYPEINIHYFPRCNNAIEFFKQQGLNIHRQFQINPPKVIATISINRSAHIIDQLYLYFQERFKVWQFLPSLFVVNQYPFVEGLFVLKCKIPNAFVTDNDSLFDFIRSVNVENNTYVSNVNLSGVDDAGHKIKYIFKSFRKANLLTVFHPRHGEFAIPFLIEEENCDCYLCKWNNQEYNSILESLNRSPAELDEIIDQGYAAYKLYEYKKSIEIFEAAKTLATTENRIQKVFICQYNIRALIELYDRTKYSQEFPDSIAAKGDFDIDSTINLLEQKDKEIARWVYDDNFINEALFQSLRELSRLKKSISNNVGFQDQSVRFLFEKLDNTIKFLTANRIVFGHLDSFTELFAAFQEGWAAKLSHSIEQQTHSIKLNNHLMHVMVQYGRRNNLVQSLRHYHISIIPYEGDNSAEWVNGILKLLDQMSFYPTNEWANPGPSNFHQSLRRMLNLYLIFAQNIDLSALRIDAIAKKIYNVFTLAKGNIQFNEEVCNFLTRYANVLDSGVLADFVLAYINHRKFLDYETTTRLIANLTSRGSRFTFAGENTVSLLARINQALEEQDIEMISLMLPLSRLSRASEDYPRIEDLLRRSLEETFQGGVFNSARIHGFLINDTDLFEHYVVETENYLISQPVVDNELQDLISDDIQVNQFINLHFKEHFTLSEAIRTALMKRSDYYAWLMNLDEFDYSKFDYNWIWRAYTIYYKAHFKKSEVLKNSLMKMLIKTQNPNISATLIEIFVQD